MDMDDIIEKPKTKTLKITISKNTYDVLYDLMREIKKIKTPYIQKCNSVEELLEIFIGCMFKRDSIMFNAVAEFYGGIPDLSRKGRAVAEEFKEIQRRMNEERFAEEEDFLDFYEDEEDAEFWEEMFEDDDENDPNQREEGIYKEEGKGPVMPTPKTKKKE